MRSVQRALLCLLVVLHSACGATPPQLGTETTSPARVTIRFQNAHAEPPKEIPVKTPQGQIVTLYLDRPLSGGFFRYSVQAISAQQLQYLVNVLDRRPDIETVEPDQRRRID